ncbi:hypothetical protein HD554DRAFT_2039333 [Boletus coccyginus]|nr:hypothetical protein HD554DRAFT_2039333 [Boletus coccyginus]
MAPQALIPDGVWKIRSVAFPGYIADLIDGIPGGPICAYTDSSSNTNDKWKITNHGDGGNQVTIESYSVGGNFATVVPPFYPGSSLVAFQPSTLWTVVNVGGGKYYFQSPDGQYVWQLPRGEDREKVLNFSIPGRTDTFHTRSSQIILVPHTGQPNTECPHLISRTVPSRRVEFINLDLGLLDQSWALVLASTYARQKANNARHKQEKGRHNIARGIHIRRNLEAPETTYEVNDILSKESNPTGQGYRIATKRFVRSRVETIQLRLGSSLQLRDGGGNDCVDLNDNTGEEHRRDERAKLVAERLNHCGRINDDVDDELEIGCVMANST